MGGRVEERPSSAMMIDADHEPRRKIHNMISHSISSSVASYAFGQSDWADHEINNLEQRRQRADGVVLSLGWDEQCARRAAKRKKGICEVSHLEDTTIYIPSNLSVE